ncbi:MAG: glycosyltransferase [Armatimonadota bacterium]
MLSIFSNTDWLMVWRDVNIAVTWFVVLVFLFSGLQDVVYDLWAYAWRIYRRLHYGKRERLTLSRLRLRDQQHVAVWVPAWQEAEVIDKMVENILHRVEYRDYTIFVGTYPNDTATQRAVDVLAAAHPQVVKVVTAKPGPTNKADCLNNVYRAMKAYEARHGVHFDIVVMHDAEDVVHPYSFLLYNYLLPRVDVVQLPILPLPVSPMKWIAWVYADEFAENHLKDMLVREKMHGFVPYAGVGTGFSRRVFTILEERYGDAVFNETTMTEDYNLSKRTRDAGLTSIFINLVLADDQAKWTVPLSKRPGFMANWAYFPTDFMRSVRQKSRWVVGISLQEWERSGWKGDLAIKENLIKDRKVFISSATTLLGYLLFGYAIIAELGEHGILPVRWLPFIWEGTLLYDLVLVSTGLMLLRMVQRVAFVSRVYGLVAGLLSLPRIFVGNVVNGFAAFRALQQFFAARKAKTEVQWDKTEHREGVGVMPVETPVAKHNAVSQSCANAVTLLSSLEAWEAITMLESLQPDCSEAQRGTLNTALAQLAHHTDHHVRAVTARVLGQLTWPELLPITRELLFDTEWVVRANAAAAFIRFNDFPAELPAVLQSDDRYAIEVLVHTLEQDERALEVALDSLQATGQTDTHRTLSELSPVVRGRIAPLITA